MVEGNEFWYLGLMALNYEYIEARMMLVLRSCLNWMEDIMVWVMVGSIVYLSSSHRVYDPMRTTAFVVLLV